MPTVCPECLRELAAGTAAAARFCMYCGHKLAADATPVPSRAEAGNETQAFLPDPSGSASPSPDGRTPFGPPAGPPDPAPAAGRVAGYTLLRFLGAGGMGTVYEAEVPGSGRRVAVKVLSGRLAANPASVERFRQEGRVASQISHPRCVFVLAADTDAGRPFIVMELMPGRTLKDLLDARGPRPVAEAIDRILDVIDGLAEAHRQGVIHRDVKPSNCFLTDDDRVKVGDFGLSKSLTTDDESAGDDGTPAPAAGHLTTSGAFLGTVLYASPEQIRGEPVGYDSDVYAVCGTLYYLLAGRAPFQHESLTASLAKAVSEPPPPLRPKRPDVPRELEKVILKGLDRDRGRRWPTVEALRDALVGLRPDAQRPARLGGLVLAYLADSAILAVAAVPVQLAWQAAADRADVVALGVSTLPDAYLPSLGLSVTYFGLCEGLTGATPGKRVMRLRVARVGGVGPPGVGRAALRSLVFSLIWLPVFAGVDLLGVLPPGVDAAAAVVVTGVGVGLVCVQLKKTPLGWRGVHDRATGCRVVERPRPPYRPHLLSHFPNPLDLVTAGPVTAPAAVGGFVIAGRLARLPDGAEVWLADDRGLGRRVLLHVLPAGTPAPAPPAAGEVTRPTRPRVVGRGVAAWPVGAGKIEARPWAATVAPAGAPLADVATPDRPLAWADARPILEQLADELATAAADGTATPAGVSQVWVEPNGRPQVLDFPLPAARPVPGAGPVPAMELVRQVATLALEGTPRAGGGRVRAPLPLPAAAITDKLFSATAPYDSLEQLREDLAESAARPAAVTGDVRRTHLGLWLPLAGFGLVWMVLAAGLVNFAQAAGSAGQARDLAHLRDRLGDPVRRAEFLAAAGPDIAARVAGDDKLDETRDKLDEAARTRKDAEAMYRDRLNRAERFVFDRLDLEDRAEPDLARPGMVGRYTNLLRALDRPAPAPSRSSVFARFGLMVCVPPVIWAALAFVFRGGLALTLAGIAHVTADGRRAGRVRCLARELVVWLPVTAALVAAVWFQAVFPDRIGLRTGVWLAAVALLPVYLGVALRYPARPPQDRLLGMWLVPG